MPHFFNVRIDAIDRVCETPNTCPICHHKITIPSPHQTNVLGKEVQALFQCPNNDCRNFFIAYYELDAKEKMDLVSYKPSKVVLDDIPDSVRKISPTFPSIFAEAAEARAQGLEQIAGPGYRKAFEFLIKDYAKTKSESDQHPLIEKAFSGEVISKYVGDIRIQTVGKRALWLGNDETHYLRKWQKHDIEDLINLIKLTIGWIEIEQLSAAYTEEIPEEPSKNP